VQPGETVKLPATTGQIFGVRGQNATATNPPHAVVLSPTRNRALPNDQHGEIPLYPLAHNRDVTDLKSIDAKTATSITFVNETTNDVDVDWIDYRGQRQRYRTLKSRESYRQETFVSHPWDVVVEGHTSRFLPTARAEYKVAIGSTHNPTLIHLQGSESENLRSGANGAATSINFFNGSTSDANIFWIDMQGKRQHYKTLKQGEVDHQHTFINHPWEVVADGKTTRYMPIDSEADVYIN